MKRTDWQNAFGEVDEDFHLRLRSTLNGLEEKDMKKRKNYTAIMLAAALIVAALMGLSRLYVGVHYPSDVLAGAVIGTVCGLLGAWIIRRFTQWRQSRKAAE